VGDASILIAFIVALGLIFVVAAWVLAGSDVPAERESNGQGIIASSTPTRVRPCPGQCPRREGRSYTWLSNGKLERNIGECAGSGVLSHFPAERLGVELEFEQPSRSQRLLTKSYESLTYGTGALFRRLRGNSGSRDCVLG
jgi:hypothetical protein